MLAHNPYCAQSARVSPPPMPRFDDSILRMIDANLNRTREGLRVMEDCARFVLNDEPLSARLKSARHALRSAIDALPIRSDDLIFSRDTSGDVGTGITTENEHRRDGLKDSVSAAAKRATEALRVIEESAKVLGVSGASFESIRYALYDIERDLLIAIRPPCPQWSLCVLITSNLCTHRNPIDIVALAAEGGADCIQIREKDMPDAQLLDHAARLTELAQLMGMHVMINDRVHIAKLVGANGVHLGQDDLPITAARSLLGHGFWIGRTTPTINHAIEAIEQGADTCGLGPVFASTTKAKPTLAGLKLIENYLSDERTRSTPMLAISGINTDNVNQLAAIACPGVAVSSAICSSEDPRAVTRSIVDALHSREPNHTPTITA
ncbi:MAG: thiamine phosphate synthase [Phycisphaerales bacterium]